MVRKSLGIMAVLLVLFSEVTMAQSWSDANYQSPNWGNDYNSKTSFDINNEREFAKFAYMVGHGYDFEGKTVTLKAHLNLNRNYWTPIGTEEHPFRGSFSGSGYSISGMHFEEGVGGYVGLFGYVSGGSVADVLLTGSTIAGGQYAGSIAGGVSNAQIADCYMETSVTLSRTTATGHVAGLLSKGAKVLGCASNAKAADGADRFGIVGSKDETSVVWHSLYADAERFIVGIQPAFRVVNKIEDATINYGVPTSSYSVSNIVAYENGMSFAGSYLAVEGETVTFSVEGNTITMYSRVMVDGRSLTASDGWYSFQMQAGDVNITQEEIMLEWESGTTVCRLDAGTFTVEQGARSKEQGAREYQLPEQTSCPLPLAPCPSSSMANYAKPEDAPWYAYRNEIKTLVFEDGVTEIGENAFAQSQQMNTITIPLSMKRIGKHAFRDCSADDVYCYPAAKNLLAEENVFKNMPQWHVFSAQVDGYNEMSDNLHARIMGDLNQLTLDANGDNTLPLEAADGSVCDVTIQNMRLVREGFTLCVPFTVSNIARTPLVGAEIHEIIDIKVIGKNLRLRIGNPVGRIEAGKMYYGFWKTPGGDLYSPVFRNVTLSAAAPERRDYGTSSLQGLYNATTNDDLFTTEVLGKSFWESIETMHSAFQVCIMSQEQLEKFKLVVCDCNFHVVHTGKPEWWPDVMVQNGDMRLDVQDMVTKGSELTLTAALGVGYDLEWYVDGVKQKSTATSISVTVNKDTQVEVRYTERKKLTFKGSPLVRYADEKGVVNITQNYYNYNYIKERAFGNTVQSWTGSNGKTYLVDNLLQDNKVTTDTLTADVEMVPTTVLNEEDMGDNTVTVAWRFDLPDSMALFRNHHGEGAKFPYVMPTQFASYYIDVAMTIDATNGLISNDLRKAEGNTFVGKGTKLTVPARYGATYKLLTTKPLSDVSIEGSKDFVSSKLGNNYLATMQYYRTDLDSVVIEIGEDIELIRLEANYPGGDNELMVRPSVNKAESTITTHLKSGESGGLLYNLSDVQNRGNLKITPSATPFATSLIEMPAQFDENRYMSVSFEVKEGYSFKPKTTNLFTMPVNTGTKANVRLMLIDEFGNKADTIFQNVAQNVMKLDTLKPKAPSKAEELCLYGKIELRIYVYGTEGNYRLGDSITIGGELCQTIRFPEGQTYVPRLITSPIDFDGIGLVTIDAYEVVHADEDKQLVTMTALEECPMGNVMLLKSDIPGGLYNIPLTRADDSYIAGQSILRVSDGSVIGTKHHYVFGIRDGVYGFFMAAIGDPIAEGNVYFYHNGIKDLLAYYIDPADVPPVVDEVILFADGDNNQTIKDNKGRHVSRVTLGGRTFYKDGRWNVVTLPFNILGRDIKKTPLKNATICEFDPEYSSFNAATGLLNLTFENAYEIEAGKPYLVSWNRGEDLPNPTFEDVTFFDNSLVEETSSDGLVTFRPSYSSIDFKDSAKTLLTVRKSMAADSCMHAMKGFFAIETAGTDVSDVDVEINVDNPVVNMDVAGENGLYSVLYNKVVDFEKVTLIDYTGEGGIVQMADSITAIIDGSDVQLAVHAIDANVFSSMGHEITALDLSRCRGLKPLTIERSTPDTPFFGLNEAAIIYLPAGKAQPADNVVVGGIASRLVLDDQYGFTPLYDFKAEQVVLRRSTTAIGGWQAVCLPFTLTRQMVQQRKGRLLAFSGAKKENGTLTLFMGESNAVPAGTPAMIRLTDGTPAEMTFSNIDVAAVTADSADYNGVSLFGSYMPVDFSSTASPQPSPVGEGEVLPLLFVTDSRTDAYSLPGFQAYFVMDDDTTSDFSSVCVNYADVAEYEAIEGLTGRFDVAYAIWCDDSKTLYFTIPDSPKNPGDSFNGHTVTNIWKGAAVLLTGNNVPAWAMVAGEVKHVVFDESFQRARPTSCYKWFYNFKRLTDIDGLHYLCTSEVTTMASMFDGCSALSELTLGFFDTSNVTDMNSMFYGCTALTALNLLSWKTWQVTDMSSMFSRCHNLSVLYLDNFDTQSVTNMGNMFYDCKKLSDINLTSFDTRNVVNMIAMFKNCHALKELDLTSFNTASVTNVQFMFENDYALTTITVGQGWTMENVLTSNLMFYLDASLVGQNGTRYQYSYDSNPASYAHIDGGSDNPGLLWGIVDVALHDLADNSETLRRYGGHRVNVTYDREFSAIQNSDGTWTSRAFTVCLPYSKDLSSYFDAGQIRLYQLAFASDDHEFTFVGQPPLINAGTPYLLVVEKGTVSLDAQNVKMLPHPNEQIEEDIVYSSLEAWGDPDDLVGWWRGTFTTISNEECTRMHHFALSMKDGCWKTFNNDTQAHRASYIPQFRAYFIPFEYSSPDDYVTRFKYIPAGDDDVNPDDWERLPDEFVGDINEDPTGIKGIEKGEIVNSKSSNSKWYDLSGRKLPRKPQKGIYIDNGIKRSASVNEELRMKSEEYRLRRSEE